MRRQTVLAALTLLLTLTACADPARDPWPTATPAEPVQSGSVSLVSLAPVPVTLEVPLELADATWVSPLTGDYIDSLAPEAAIQVEYRWDPNVEAMVTNAYWFTISQYNALMAGAESPKGKTIGLVDGHVLFIQPALDMPFDPGSADGERYITLVEAARSFGSYRMNNPALVLLRPCPVPSEWPTTDVSPALRTAVTKYFREQALLPVTITNKPWALDVDEQSAGTHECANPDGGVGGYVGMVPAGSVAAVMLQAHHAPYATTGASDTFVTLAQSGDGVWSVVNEGTGP